MLQKWDLTETFYTRNVFYDPLWRPFFTEYCNKWRKAKFFVVVWELHFTRFCVRSSSQSLHQTRQRYQIWPHHQDVHTTQLTKERVTIPFAATLSIFSTTADHSREKNTGHARIHIFPSYERDAWFPYFSPCYTSKTYNRNPARIQTQSRHWRA
jgi:hypothetical protein